MATVRRYRDRWVADFRDQHGRRRIEVPVGTFESKALEKRAAQELLTRRQAEVQALTFTPERQRVDFAKLCELFLASKVKARQTTLDDYGIMIDCYLAPYFGARKVETLTRLDVERFRADMQAGTPEVVRLAREAHERRLQVDDPQARLKPLKPGARTTNKCLGLLRSILGYAVSHNLATRNVAERMDKLPTVEGEGRVIEQNVLTPAELRAVIEAATDPNRIPIALAVYTGMRQAEALGLQWGDIDWNKGTAEIRRTWRCGQFYMPKTASSRRTVELPAELVAMLKRWRLACPKGEHDLVCPSVKGNPMQASALHTRGFVPALRRAGIRRVRFHDLRHSFASNLLAAGVDVVTVSKALGHANVHITLVTYAHAVPSARHGAGDRMAALMGHGGNNLETGASGEAATGSKSVA
jgi:integrase